MRVKGQHSEVVFEVDGDRVWVEVWFKNLETHKWEFDYVKAPLSEFRKLLLPA